ncbi:conserved hypothetical protein [Heterostelium album PN500]|uniref:Glycosyl hydrolase family 71 n=1 Tax=Heterostelium pallidum (strain ATCC 26659 / Pp 5 / PN500) TaxID=670386 RepID=D3BK54_HETP5|nr:conserved hypothetical protein [Heterostelium album PN500]EFA78284.1 conserved hypothetical protein [Heterostelium album PN500]|eukprot:XP_020430409.1 conserved hypothetical protein [Heterostelium album PN500]
MKIVLSLLFIFFVASPILIQAVEFNLTSCWPFTDSGTTALLNSPKKVFAHYFSLFPISIDNKVSTDDYYTNNFLKPTGEGGKHLQYGGFIRERPLPRPVRPDMSTYRDLDMQLEVTRALSLGLDGFTYDMLSSDETSDHWKRLILLMKNAPIVDSRFKIVLMPDMLAGWSNTANIADTFVPIIKKLWDSPYNGTLLRDSTGKLVLSPYRADSKTGAWWQNQITKFNQVGIQISFWPVFPDINQNYLNNYGSISVGQSEWDGNCVSTAPGFVTASNFLHNNGKKYMSPVMSQNHRPKSYKFWEANNSGAIRAMWNSAIVSGAEWIQIITWNDYSEGTELSPSTGTQFSYYDISAYYLRWYKLGQAPVINRDALYYFHRNSLSTQQPDLTKQNRTFTSGACDPVSDKVEALVFLTGAATVEIIQNGQTYSTPVNAAGITSVRTQLLAGATPRFRVIRGTNVIIDITSSFPVATSVVYQDLLYRGGGSLTCTRPSV